MDQTAPPSPYLASFVNFSGVVRGLRDALNNVRVHRLLGLALIMLLSSRLGGICGKLQRLAARFEAGTLRRVAPRTIAVDTVGREARTGPRPARIWPARYAWLVEVMAHVAVGYGSQLQAILARPEMVALLIAAPQAGRMLRPICRMLAVDMSVLRPRPAGAPAETVPEPIVKVAKKRVRKRREPVDWGRIPLPRGVLSAARRQGFGKIR